MMCLKEVPNRVDGWAISGFQGTFDRDLTKLDGIPIRQFLVGTAEMP
ncbi:MAG: hypothetical protein MUO33_12100 [Sedimentisphaerales bacterium]|nr:hypothetical protein [Sedimentisphaerales bacterium]